eukprot:jgi/Astpho2/6155/fgenesh1_pm.00088_%23_2_t
MAAVVAEKEVQARTPSLPFVKLAGQEEMKLAILLNVVDPNIGGVLIMGDRGTGKSVAVRAMVDLLPMIPVVPDDPFNSSPTDVKMMGPDVLRRYQNGEQLPAGEARTPLVELPLGATEDRICGTIDIEKALQEGIKAYEPGLLAKANRGILYVDEVNLLEDGLVDVVLDSAASGINTVEREGISIVHPAKFIMIGSGSPQEGEMRPQLLDRFGMSVSVSTMMDVDVRTQMVLDRLAYEQDPDGYYAKCEEEQSALRQKLVDATRRLKSVQMDPDVRLKISEICSLLNVDGIRGDIVINRAARALVALEGRTTVELSDVGRIISICLNHRLRKDPLEQIDTGSKVRLAFQRITRPKAAVAADDSTQQAKTGAQQQQAPPESTPKKAGAWAGLP